MTDFSFPFPGDQDLTLEEWVAFLRSRGHSPEYIRVAMERARMRGCAADRRRRRKLRREVQLDDHQEDPTDWLAAIESRDELTFHLMKLPVLWRCILLARLQGYSHRETGRLLGLSETEVARMTRKAFQFLRDNPHS